MPSRFMGSRLIRSRFIRWRFVRSRFIRVTAGALIAVCIEPTSATVVTRAPQTARPFAAHAAPARTVTARTFPLARRVGQIGRPAGCSSDFLGYFLGIPSAHDVADNESGVLAGSVNEACDGSGAIAAGNGNVIGGDESAALSMIGAGLSNMLEGAYSSFIGAGVANVIGPGTPTYPSLARYSGIGAGAGNTIGSPYSFIGGGNLNVIAPNALTNESVSHGESSFIGSGSDNTITSNFAVISGGQENTVGGDLSAIGGGSANQTLATYAVIGGGEKNTVTGASAVVGGGYANSANGPYAVVAGGGNNTADAPNAFVGGGATNTASGTDSVVGGGTNNVASAPLAIVVGGNANRATGVQASIVGGDSNVAGGEASFIGAGTQNVASGEYGTIPGGHANTASGFSSAISGGSNNVASGTHATVAGGLRNIAAGANSFAAGTASNAATAGSFVWSDDAAGAKTLAATASNQFLARASGGYFLYSSANLGSGVELAPGSGSWSTLSDRAAKTGIEDVNAGAVLAQLAGVAVSEWSYIAQGPGVRHVGPMAQDFRAAFGLGEDDKHIATVDAGGVALAAIKALAGQYRARERTIADLRAADRGDAATIATLRKRLDLLETGAQTAQAHPAQTTP